MSSPSPATTPEYSRATTLYLAHFGLREAPFKITPAADFFYSGGRRGEILHALLYAMNAGEGIMMVSGEVGSGKTMLLRTLLEKLPPKIDTIFIANPSLSGQEILYNICEDLGLEASETRPDTVRMLQNHLIKRYHEGYKVIAFIDEAQAIPDESLEELRLLTNLETDRDKLLQIVLFGQPELEEKISQQHMRQLRERITVKLELQPFDRLDVREYMATRLRAAGYNGAPIFTNESCRLIAAISQGLSRRINVLADRAMLSAYARESHKVQLSDVRRAIKDVNFGQMRYRSEQSRRLSKQITIGLSILAIIFIGWVVDARYLRPPSIVPAADTPAVAETDDAAQAGSGVATSATSGEVPPPEPTFPASEPRADINASAATTATEPSVDGGADTQTNQDRAALQTAIDDLRRGDESLVEGDFADQLAAVAESHEQTPQNNAEELDSGDGASFADATDPNPHIQAGNIDNPRWSWMPTGSYVRGRLNATETWLKSNRNTSLHTVRLLTVDQSRSVFLEKFLRYFADFYSIRNVMVYPVRLQSGEKFVVTYGIYPSPDEARVFIRNIPYYFTGGTPFAQRLSVSARASSYAWASAQ